MYRWCYLLKKARVELVALTETDRPRQTDLKFIGGGSVHGYAYFQFP